MITDPGHPHTLVDIALGVEHHGLARHVELELDALILLKLLGDANGDLEPVVGLLVSYLVHLVVATGWSGTDRLVPRSTRSFAVQNNQRTTDMHPPYRDRLDV